jgi:hypothetical protein
MNRGVHNLFFGRLGSIELLHDPSFMRDEDAIGQVKDFGQIGRRQTAL